MNTWIVVAHRGGARLVEVSDSDEMSVVETLEHPEARTNDRPSSRGGREPVSDRGHHERPPLDAVRDHDADVFAHELAARLKRGRTDHRYRELVLIAAPRFLGALRQALDGATSALVRGTLDKDYAGLSDRELLQRLERL